MPKGKKNQYTCKECFGVITTVDLDEGTTSMFLACRVTEGCAGRMVSSMYQVDQDLAPTHEWYTPSKLPKGEMRQHVKMGGLLIRPVTEAAPTEQKLCVCGCGKPVPSHANFADVACVLRIFQKTPGLSDAMGAANIEQAIEIVEQKNIRIEEVRKPRKKGFQERKGKRPKGW